MSELLATVVKLAGEGLDLLVHNLVCSNIAPLGKGFATNIATVGSFASVSSLVCLVILVCYVDEWQWKNSP